MTFTHKINHDSRKISGTANSNQILKFSLSSKINTGSLCSNLKKSPLSGNFMLDLNMKNNSESVEMKIDTLSKPY
jgi:hypothetical protein